MKCAIKSYEKCIRKQVAANLAHIVEFGKNDYLSFFWAMNRLDLKENLHYYYYYQKHLNPDVATAAATTAFRLAIGPINGSN